MPVSQQPASVLCMSSTSAVSGAEKSAQQTEDGHRACSHAHAHARSRKSWRQRIIPALALLMVLGTLIALTFADLGSYSGHDETMFRRELGNGTGGTNNGNNRFVKNKLYLIIVFVGLFLCVVAAIMLSACCCRGAFENPICCPCYLCACIGGLGCIECIACGLCAEGVSDINV